MAYRSVKRRGHLWDDMYTLDALITSFNFNISAARETDFEKSFSSVLMSRQNEFQNDVVTQINKEQTVQSVYCFGKKHRPDLTLGTNGAAIELKHIDATTDGLRTAIGQAHLYRLKYGFVVLVLIMSPHNKTLYEKVENKEEKDLEDMLTELEANNIFTYIVPAFKTGNKKKCLSYFPQRILASASTT